MEHGAWSMEQGARSKEQRSYTQASFLPYFAHMKVSTLFRFISLILIPILYLQACNNLSGDRNDTGGDATIPQDAAGPQQWHVNLNDAYAQSVRDKKPVLLYFSASDTCGMCTQLEANVFSTPEFKRWAEKKVVLFEVDFSTLHQLPQGSQEQNTAMARSLKVATYPTIWMLSVTHEVEKGRFKVKPIGYTGYQPSTEKLIGVLQNFVRR